MYEINFSAEHYQLTFSLSILEAIHLPTYIVGNH